MTLLNAENNHQFVDPGHVANRILRRVNPHFHCFYIPGSDHYLFCSKSVELGAVLGRALKMQQREFDFGGLIGKRSGAWVLDRR